MKRWFAMILAAAIALSMAACTAEQPPETTPPTTTAATTEATTEPTTEPATEPVISSFTIGNLKFTLEPGMSVRESRFGSYIVSVVPNEATAEFIAKDISHVSVSQIGEAVQERFDNYTGQYGEKVVGVSEFDISFNGFDASGEVYSNHDGTKLTYTHMDFAFTDTWYAYIVLYTVKAGDSDTVHNYGELLGEVLASVEYIGEPQREPEETTPTETQKPQNTQQEKPPKETKPSVTPSPKPTDPPATTAPKETEPPAGPTTGERNALKKAKDYLRLMAFSYQGLIEQLEYEGFTTAEATYAADNCGADWNEQALKKAKDYLDLMPFSYTGLIKQLQYEDYTKAQATYGADNCGADWYAQAARAAKKYLDLMSFSRSELISQLEYEGYTHDQAVYGAEQNGL